MIKIVQGRKQLKAVFLEEMKVTEGFFYFGSKNKKSLFIGSCGMLYQECQ